MAHVHRARLARRWRAFVRTWGDRFADIAEGVETTAVIEAADVETGSPNKARGIRYQPTPRAPLLAVLGALDVPRGLAFVDIGAGKGRVLLLAQRFGFGKLVGVEYSESLCQIARRNLAAARRGTCAADCVIHCCDAADYRFPENESVIYLFNPFDAQVLTAMLDHLAGSLRQQPRDAWLIYHFPRWFEVIEASGLFRRQRVERFGDDEFAIYFHAAAG